MPMETTHPPHQEIEAAKQRFARSKYFLDLGGLAVGLGVAYFLLITLCSEALGLSGLDRPLLQGMLGAILLGGFFLLSLARFRAEAWSRTVSSGLLAGPVVEKGRDLSSPQGGCWLRFQVQNQTSLDPALPVDARGRVITTRVSEELYNRIWIEQEVEGTVLMARRGWWQPYTEVVMLKVRPLQNLPDFFSQDLSSILRRLQPG
jgi:hypothetical protein